MQTVDNGGEAMLFNPLPSPSSTTTSFPRTPSDLFPPRLRSAQSGQPARRGMKLNKGPQSPSQARSRAHSKSNDKGKEPVHEPSDVDSPSTFGRGNYVPHSNGTSLYSSHDSRRPSTADGNNVNGRSKFRGSLLVAASDALGFKFGRRRPSIRQPVMPIILPDVIEISASRADEEVEERNRLREMAAQAIGLGPYIVSQDSQSRDDSATDEDEEVQSPASDSTEARRLGYARSSESTPNIGARSPHESSQSVTTPQHSQPAPGGRYRSGSVAAGHSPSNSTTIAPIPSFPSTVSSLTSFRQSSGMYPKYYPPSSLRIFALSKNWKNRFLLLSSPATLVTRGQGPAVSYLHLFKSSNPEDKELERLEINEDSVVFVAEEEVGGKSHVIKVAGADVGAMKKDYMHEEGGHTMWLLQIPEQADAQKWITNIKNAILGQRTVRAGLIPALSLGNNEPRGDMDVMLSIRAQGLITSPTSANFRPMQNPSPIPFSQGDTNPNYASSISSHSVRSQTTVAKPASPTGAVSALKGLFANSGRPRSASRATSIESDRHQEREANDGSFTSMGSNLLGMLRSSTPDTQSINTVQTSPIMRTNLPFAGPVHPIDRRIDRKIISDRQPAQWSSPEPIPSTSKDRVNRGFSLGALSLQPPPRKRWTSSGPTGSTNRDQTRETQTPESTRRVSFSASLASGERTEPEVPLTGFQFGTPERPRAPSLLSVSTYASGENGISMERSSSSTKRSSGTRSARRWSRQGILPHRLTPPTEPPPAIPTTQPAGGLHPYAAEQSNNSSHSSPRSVVSALPSFSKRASGSSSINSFSTTHSHPASTSSFQATPVATRASSTHRSSMPPPRPAPTSALPPAPVETNQDVLKPMEANPGSSKASFRSSVASRTFRLSMVAPKPPPSTTLPPRPDEPEYKNHRRSSSGSGINTIAQSTKLETIPASPIPPSKTVNPFPPPVGPLPPTPAVSPPPPSTQPVPPPKRTTSIKQRLRILSAPVPSSNQSQTKLRLSRPQTSDSVTAPPLLMTSPPPTPIAEKITMFQNDPSFLHMHTPVMPSLPPPAALLPLPPDEIAEVTSLSPPPRRGSKQLLETELESPTDILTHALSDKLPTVIEPTNTTMHLALSRPGSAMSNRSHHSQPFLEVDWESPKEETAREELPLEKYHSPVEPRHISLSRPGSVVSLGIVTL